MKILEGRNAIVTGAGRGLGRAYAIALAEAGAKVVVNDIDADEAQQVALEIAAAGGTSLASSDDIGDWNAAKRAVDICARAFGSVDVLVNNAAYTRVCNIWEEDEAGFEQLLRANLKGTFAMTRHALAHMMPRRSGSIINVTSGSQSGVAPRSVYAASKGGVSSATYTWAIELAEHGIRVNAISPMAETRMSPNPVPPGTLVPPHRLPENVAPLVVYLASDESRWITGQVFRLGGRKLSLYAHPRPRYETKDERGWSFDVLKERVRKEFGPKLEPVGVTATEYVYAR
jgi:NAD(P)-dependent dehydrogenase (short-subunit alcohol dehydrogenase family)